MYWNTRARDISAWMPQRLGGSLSGIVPREPTFEFTCRALDTATTLNGTDTNQHPRSHEHHPHPLLTTHTTVRMENDRGELVDL